MPNKKILNKYAHLAVEMGANVQKDQLVWINSSTETRELTRLITEYAYEAGAKEVHVNWNDAFVGKLGLANKSLETLKDVPTWLIDKFKDFTEKEGCVISVSSPFPGLNKDIDPKRLQTRSMATSKALNFFREHMMGNRSQWSIVAAPNSVWAQKVFPELETDEAIEKLWDAIFKASRVTADNDPVKEWKKHNQALLKHNNILNDHQFKTLKFKNSIGTDFTLDLVKNHVWSGGREISKNGVTFNPNIPTEENFTMPHKFGVNGKVVATKPLNYQGNLIEDFWLEFKDGKVVDYGAEKAEPSLKNLIEFDDGSSYLGEIALISYHSPISMSNTLFFNTLFDENASCHMALGRAYPMNVKNGNDMSKEELEEVGSNQSMTHVDFMFGSKDLEVIGLKENDEEVQIFKNGDYVI
ncbi:MAG: aminopeptidase [Candidatus Izimaplasma sp.]|nr:aminopeptidase [Candidatus Izimaplasma bacterium]